ncbi:MAG: hypothetical protein IKB61_00560 [Elusimicrobiaceae bacterium]|nr:hypothetical protein [Elusimicrobiaceae bacterium]
MAKTQKPAEQAEQVEDVKEKGKGKDKAVKVRTFFKKEFVKSERFAKHKDLVNALLEDDKKYSIKEVEDTIHNFLYGKKK